MAAVAVVTDTTHYLPRELVAAHALHEVSLYINWSDRQEREADLPDFDAFYARLRSGDDLPTTSQPSVGDFLAVWEPLLAEGREVVSIHISGALSGTVGAAEQARERLVEHGTGERVHVLDAETVAGGLGLVLLGAAAAARAGADAAGVLAEARATRAALKILASIDTLEFLRRGGRIGPAAAWLGSSLKIKPIVALEAEIVPVERVRTAGRAFGRLVDHLRTRHEAGAQSWVVQHIQAHEQAERLAERGREIYGSEPLFVSEIGPVVGAHAGPGLLGAGALVPRAEA